MSFKTTVTKKIFQDSITFKTGFFNRHRDVCAHVVHVANVDQDGTWAGSLLLPFPGFCSCSGDREGTLHRSVHEARSLSRSG